MVSRRESNCVNYDAQLLGVRMRLGLTQSELAERIGAASKAVVYQWESRRRAPTGPVGTRAAIAVRLSRSRRHGPRKMRSARCRSGADVASGHLGCFSDQPVAEIVGYGEPASP